MNLLKENYKTIQNLRSVNFIVQDISALQMCYKEKNREIIEKTLNQIIQKYQKDIQQIGKLYTKIPIISGENVYRDKTMHTLLRDIEYIIDCLIIIASVKSGIERGLGDVLHKLTSER